MWTQLNILVTATATPLAEQLMTAKTGVSNVLSVQLVPIGSPAGTQPTWYGGSGAVATELVPLLTDAQVLADEAGIDLAQAEWLLGAESDITLIEDVSIHTRHHWRVNPSRAKSCRRSTFPFISANMAMTIGVCKKNISRKTKDQSKQWFAKRANLCA